MLSNCGWKRATLRGENFDVTEQQVTRKYSIHVQPAFHFPFNSNSNSKLLLAADWRMLRTQKCKSSNCIDIRNLDVFLFFNGTMWGSCATHCRCSPCSSIWFLLLQHSACLMSFIVERMAASGGVLRYIKMKCCWILFSFSVKALRAVCVCEPLMCVSVFTERNGKFVKW